MAVARQEIEKAGPEVKARPPLAVTEKGPRAKWWRRRGSKNRGFWYEGSNGKRIEDEEAIQRIKSLVIPPAWTQVRISPSSRTPIQAVGMDTSGRIQYKYNPTFAARRQQKKYDKIVRFGEVLPSLRKLTNEHISQGELSKEQVLAVVVRLINDLYFRVGSESSVKRYRTYGITTLRNHHLEIKRGGQLVFSFVGKHHIRHRRILVDPELASLMTEIKKIGGPKLFEYYDAEGKVRPITPRDVNEYIKAATGPEFSAKDFRTWGGTLQAAVELAEIGCPENERQAKKNIVWAVKRVAEHLGNTPTVCRSCYVHPAVFEKYEQGVTLDQIRRRVERSIKRICCEYDVEEVALLKLLSK
jgi:DNA topoisomerase I